MDITNRMVATTGDRTSQQLQDLTFWQEPIKVQIIGKDRCGNEDTYNMTDDQRLQADPYCLNGIATIVMQITGSVQMWAKDF